MQTREREDRSDQKECAERGPDAGTGLPLIDERHRGPADSYRGGQESRRHSSAGEGPWGETKVQAGRRQGHRHQNEPSKQGREGRRGHHHQHREGRDRPHHPPPERPAQIGPANRRVLPDQHEDGEQTGGEQHRARNRLGEKQHQQGDGKKPQSKPDGALQQGTEQENEGHRQEMGERHAGLSSTGPKRWGGAGTLPESSGPPGTSKHEPALDSGIRLGSLVISPCLMYQ